MKLNIKLLGEKIIKKKEIHFILFVLLIILAFSVLSCIAPEQVTKDNNMEKEEFILHPIQLKKLTTDGGVNIIENSTGNEVRLRGIVFLGGVGQHAFVKPSDVKY